LDQNQQNRLEEPDFLKIYRKNVPELRWLMTIINLLVGCYSSSWNTWINKMSWLALILCLKAILANTKRRSIGIWRFYKSMDSFILMMRE